MQKDVPIEPVDPNELAALVRRIVDGDVAALEALYDGLSPGVFGVASRLLGGHIEAVDQIVEEVFWQLWRQAPRLLCAESEACAQALNTSLKQWTIAAAGEACVRHHLPPIPFAPSLHPGAASQKHADSPATEQTA
jgi:hypothetical protein